MSIDLSLIPVYSYDDEAIDNEVSACSDSNFLKVCKYCGKQFVATLQTYGRNHSRASVCKRSHYSMCKICNAEFSQDKAISVGLKLTEVCGSKECKNKLSGLKSKQAIQKKYGVDNPFQVEFIKAKSRATCLKKYGVEQYSQSEHYRMQSKQSWDSKSDEERQAINDRRRQTCLDRYGEDNPRKVLQFQEKSKETCLKKYGVEFVSQSASFREAVAETWANKTEEELEEILSKRIATSLQNWGCEHPSQSPIIRQRMHDWWVNLPEDKKKERLDKCIQTCLERYGTIAPALNLKIQEKIRQHMLNKFGVEYVFYLPGFWEHTREVMLERYGAENAFQSSVLREKGRETNLRKYGADHPMKNPEISKKAGWNRILAYAKTIEDVDARQRYLSFMEDPIKYVITQFDHKPTYGEVSRNIGIGSDTSKIYSKVPTYLGLMDQSVSFMEGDVKQVLLNIDPSIRIYIYDHTILKPKELDLYLPDYKIGIECNPTYSHNSSIPGFGMEYAKDKNYHKMKTDMCEASEVFLFHMFGYEWTHKRDILISMLKNLLNKSDTRYYARNLDVVELSGLEARAFLDANHRQGGVDSSVRLGLKTSEGKLVSCMTFGKTRSTIGKVKSSNTWELVRFCSKLNTSVVGGASKLFQYFLRNYSYDKIISYSDRAHTRGTLYEKLGFVKASQSDPNYVWVNYHDDTYYNRVTCQKQNLRKLFKDGTIDIEHKTEKQIMVEHGYVQVYDSGTIRWEFTS